MTVKELTEKLNRMANSEEFKRGLKKLSAEPALHSYVVKQMEKIVPSFLKFCPWFIYIDGGREIISYTAHLVARKNSHTNASKHFTRVLFQTEKWDNTQVDSLRPNAIFLAVQDGECGGWSLHQYPSTEALIADVQSGNMTYGNKWKVLKEVFIEVAERREK